MSARVVIQDPELNWKGEWSAVTTYPTESVVGYDGSSYVASEQTVGDTPSDGSPWSLLASKGEQGAQGETGPAGATESTVEVTFSASTEWNHTHGLGKHPSVTTLDSLGRKFQCAVEYPDADSVTAYPNPPVGGKMILNF